MDELYTKIVLHFRKLLFPVIVILLVSCGNSHTKPPSLIELVDMDYRFSTNVLLKFCKDNQVDIDNVFQWQNHWVIYSASGNAPILAANLEKNFPRLVVRTYDTPFYNFNRQKITHKFPAAEWTHIIMTANLVKDTVMQHEYMEYHRTQFEKWPELSRGFANANFQQVLVYRNGRQLMLVISIPKGKKLDELNPKTTENNPRVNEWNKIMAHYQEGIEDAPKGSTWVMFSALH